MKYNWKNIPEFEETYKIIRKNILKNMKGDTTDLVNTFMDELENFFYYSLKQKIFTTSNIKFVLENLKKISKIGYLMEPFKEQNSFTLKNKKGILFNPDLSRDMLKFHIYKELAYCVSSIDREFIKNTTNKYIVELGMNGINTDDYERYLEYGFRLIEDGINLEMAETIYHASYNRERPSKYNINETEVFGNNISIQSNFKFFPSFQELTLLIGRTIVNDGINLSDEEVSFKLVKESMQRNFSSSLVISLISIFGKDKMIELMKNIGIVYKKEMDSSGACFIKNPHLRVTHAKKAYNESVKFILINEHPTRKMC